MCQVRAYHTELATACHCMALTASYDSKIHWTSTWDIANEIHDPTMTFKSYLTRVQTHKGVDQCSGLDSILACLLLLNFCPHILAPLPRAPLGCYSYNKLAFFGHIPSEQLVLLWSQCR